MAYTVLARQHRPQRFADLIGQTHVAQTLTQAISSGRIAHAFLFTGVRGVGKTSTARLLAKALNCLSGPTPEACNQCDACVEITAGTSMDVLEIDGASHNSVDDIRRLQESLPFRPARHRFKVIILDEVHMLSSGAFNALLKVLEEPPPHVKFIFATTETHKVPITIRSRCQRYDFRLVPQASIAACLQGIVQQEGIAAEADALALVAREAAGSMRDALTLLDQLVAYGGNTLRLEQVSEALGLADRTGLQQTVTALLRGDAKEVLLAVAGLAERGIDMLHLCRQILGWVRDLVVLQVAGDDTPLVELTAEERHHLAPLLREVGGLELQRTFAALSKLIDEIGRTDDPRTALEMGLVRIATRPRLEAVHELLQRWDAEKASSPRPPLPPTSSPAPASPTPAPPPAPAKAAPPPPAADASSWPRIVAHLHQHAPAVAAVVEHGIAVQVAPTGIVLAFPNQAFFARQAAASESLAAIRRAAAQAWGEEPPVSILDDEAAVQSQQQSSARSLAAERREQRDAWQRQQEQAALQHPRVREAIEIFPEAQATLRVRVHPPEDSAS